MDIIGLLVELYNAVLGFLGSIVTLLETIVSPITNLLQRLENLGIGG